MTKNVFFASVCGVLAAAGMAQAGTFMSMQQQSFNNVIADASVPLTFNKFNGNVADLVSVKVELFIQATGGTLQLDNDGSTNASGSGFIKTVGTVTSTQVNLINLGFAPLTASTQVDDNFAANLDPDDGGEPGTQPALDNEPGDPDYAQFFGTGGTDLASDFVNPVVFAGYVGAGTYIINADIDSDLGSLLGGAVAFGGAPYVVNGYVKVTYHYLPAPGAAALVGLGGLLVARRRR